jgi:hypothetical protein
MFTYSNVVVLASAPVIYLFGKRSNFIKKQRAIHQEDIVLGELLASIKAHNLSKRKKIKTI